VTAPPSLSSSLLGRGAPASYVTSFKTRQRSLSCRAAHWVALILFAGGAGGGREMLISCNVCRAAGRHVSRFIMAACVHDANGSGGGVVVVTAPHCGHGPAAAALQTPLPRPGPSPACRARQAREVRTAPISPRYRIRRV